MTYDEIEAESQKLEALLDAVVDVLNTGDWFPADAFGASERIYPANVMFALEKAYAAFVGEEDSLL